MFSLDFVIFFVTYSIKLFTTIPSIPENSPCQSALLTIFSITYIHPGEKKTELNHSTSICSTTPKADLLFDVQGISLCLIFVTEPGKRLRI